MILSGGVNNDTSFHPQDRHTAPGLGVFSCEAPADDGGTAGVDGSLNCHGYGSSVMVTAAFGLAAAAAAIEGALSKPL